MRTILVIMDDGSRRLVSDIPDDAKVTFGLVQPGKNMVYGTSTGTNALRIYTSQQNQLAVFVGVKEFRDLSIQVQEQKRTRKSKSSQDRNNSAFSFEETAEWDEPETF